MSDNICKKCGQKGYQGLFIFECVNPSCSAFVSAKTSSGGFSAGGVNTASSGNTSPASNATAPQAQLMSVAASNQYLDGIKFLTKMLNSGSSIAAKIAGGAPRDWFFGNEARDIDVFVEGFDLKKFLVEFPDATIAPANKPANTTTRAQGGIPPGQAFIHQNTSYTHAKFAVWDVIWRNRDFQIIALDGRTIHHHVLTFDFGLNMIMIDYTGFIDRTIYFDTDVINKTLTVYPKMMSLQTWKTIPERLEKMRAKFPGYRLEMYTK